MSNRRNIEFINQYIEANGVKKTWLAQKIGVNKSAVVNWLNPERVTNSNGHACYKIPEKRLNQICDLLGIK